MEQVKIKGKAYYVERLLSKNRTAIAGLKDRTIVITLPSKWSRKDKDETFENLLKRSIRAIEKGRWTPEGSKKLRFYHGQKLKAMGRDFRIVFSHGERFRSRMNNGEIEVTLAEHPQKHEKAAAHVRKEIVNAVMPELKARIDHYNSYFNADVKRINIRDNLTLWGSCSHDNSIISLNFRLLLMPQRVLDYVIVHELAHTKYRSHGKMFWRTVERIIPDHMEQRKWLRENGWSVVSEKKGQLTLADF